MYTYRYGGKDGKTYQLEEAKDLVVVKTQQPIQLTDHMESMSKDSRELMPALLPIASFPEIHTTVYRVLGDPETIVSKRNAVRRSLSAEQPIEFAGRALRDPRTGAIYVYTEHFFVKFKGDTPPQKCEIILAEQGLKVKEKLIFAGNAYFAAALEGTGLEIFKIAEDLLQKKEVEYCHPELIMERKERNIYPLQWHLRATTINNRLIDQHVDIEVAWEKTKGKGITIAVIDDGVDYDHTEFNIPGKVVFPRDTLHNLDDARPRYDGENHGTACAGVACAAGIEKASGVAPEANLMPIRSGGLGSMAEAKAFAWAADKGADVVSCSWGPRDGAWFNPSDPLHTSDFPLPDSTRLAIDYALENGRNGKGCVIVWAAGNGNEDVRYDGYADYPKVIAVAACNDQGRRSVYSDYGKAVWCAFPSNDFYAPSLNHPRPLTAGIWTTDRVGQKGYNPGGDNAETLIGDLAGHYTATFGGTSSACPGVAGVAALMLSVNPELNWQAVKQILRNSCDRIDETGGSYDPQGHSIYYGYGRVNAGKAVLHAAASAMQQVDIDIVGLAHFTRGSTVPLKEGRLTADPFRNNRLVAIAVNLDPFHPKLGVRYRVFINKKGASSWAENGDWTGTRDKRYKLVGLQMELFGELAQEYDIHYAVQLDKGAGLLWAKNGTISGTDETRGQAIEEIIIHVKPR